MKGPRRRCGAGLAVLGLALAWLAVGCTGNVAAPVGREAAPRDHKRMHVVQTGETLYAIAWRYGLDYRRLAAWNALVEPFVLHPGDGLRIHAPPASPRAAPTRAAAPRPKAAPARPAGGKKPDAKATSAKTTPARSAAPSPGPAARTWRWPARGRVIGKFRRSGKKGIDIESSPGSPVLAARGGRVVYSGSGLIGYGKLIILKHDKRYLSAYAHNDKLYVSEGDTVRAGQRIAAMGRTGSDRVKLHFEIRRDGKPVDPLRHLPR